MPEAVGIANCGWRKTLSAKFHDIDMQRPANDWYQRFTVLTIRAYSDANTGCGSLRVVWPQLMTAFQADAVCDFGPAGLLREHVT